MKVKTKTRGPYKIVKDHKVISYCALARYLGCNRNTATKYVKLEKVDMHDIFSVFDFIARHGGDISRIRQL